MIALGLPKTELITLIEMLHKDTVTSIDLTELMQKYGDIMQDDKVIEVNKEREKLYNS